MTLRRLVDFALIGVFALMGLYLLAVLALELGFPLRQLLRAKLGI